MLHRPTVLFLDEPTVGLDPVARHAVLDRLHRVRDALATTVLITTHDMEEAEALCDRVAFMHRGRLAATGTPRELQAALGPEASLEDVFVALTGTVIEPGGSYRDTERVRRTAQRLG